jgi:predicted DCC family thiol-disulfide oxidoreductase YuxK
MKRLFVLYDAECAFCRQCHEWLEAQAAYVELCFLPAHSVEAGRIIPGIGQFAGTGELTVVADDGAVYQGPEAFIMCLYALVEFREWSLRLARPALLPFARTFFDFISNHRATFSNWMRDRSDDELALKLGASPPVSCGNDNLNCLATVRRDASH